MSADRFRYSASREGSTATTWSHGSASGVPQCQSQTG